MLSLSCADPWPEGSMGLEEKVVTTAGQTRERDRVVDTNNNNNNIFCSSINLDDSLTSLQWLQEFPIVGASVSQRANQQLHLFSQPQGSDTPASPLVEDPTSMQLTPRTPTAVASSRVQSLPGIMAPCHCLDEVDYKTNAHIRPPYSYATLICMAMQASKKTKITLSCIYQWITDNFCYYRYADPNWQNTIRHNLSLNKCFIKVPRRKDEPGRGSFWKVNPQYAECLLSSAYKKRRMAPVQSDLALQDKLRVNLQPQPKSQRLLREFKEATAAEQNCYPHQGTMPGSLPVVREGGGNKRHAPSVATINGDSKVLRRSNSPLFPVDEQKEIGPLKEDFDWDALLDSALSGKLNLEGGEPFSCIMKEEDLTVRGTLITPGEASVGTADTPVLVENQASNDVPDFDEEAFLATTFLENLRPEEEEQGHSDFLCSSTVNVDQLFDLGESLGGDPNFWIDSLL
ncbi:hypothetical protein Q5P01_014375 [Channa striata]|uniref:Fork-head domain-containing protein n=1 Tax=Channa striata TaxID=64152 RepID=A0AA88MIQ5_CHASR|nr:hypothetical protein Q5P01_014375 [Channa striata]